MLGRAPWGKVRCMAALQRGGRAGHGVDLERDRQGRRRLAAGARTRTNRSKGFLLNHLITDELPGGDGAARGSAIPIRSPARPAGTTCACASTRPRPSARTTLPQFAAMQPLPGSTDAVQRCAGAISRARGEFAARLRGATVIVATRSNQGAHDDPAGPRHRPERLRRLPRLRDHLQGMEHLGRGGPAGRREAVRRGPDRHVLQPRADLRSRRISATRETIHFPKTCLHCEDPPCVPVCPTGASYKRKEDGIVLVDYDKCIGCKYCAWACPYGARELDEERKEMTKCTLCVDRINDEASARSAIASRPACWRARPGRACSATSRIRTRKCRAAIRERGGYQLMPEWDTQAGEPLFAAIKPTPSCACGAKVRRATAPARPTATRWRPIGPR